MPSDQSDLGPVDALGQPPASERRLDVIVPSYNRPARLDGLLRSGLALGIPGMYFFVVDDCSTETEEVPGLGQVSTAEVCRSMADPRVIYMRNPENIGVARSWVHYYRDHCRARYTLSVTDKDEFIDPTPIVNALDKMDADETISMTVMPLRQRDRGMDDRDLSFDYARMSGREYLATYATDATLMHCTMWSVIRVDAIRRAAVPRPLQLHRYGLDDGFGIDIDFVFMVATTGDVDFEQKAHVRRSTLEGGTERYPLTFAYTYYQYAKRAMRELGRRDFVSEETVRQYMGWWLLLILRGLRVAYRPVHGTELEPGTGRIRRHLRIPIHLHVLLEGFRYRVVPTKEMVDLYKDTARIMVGDWAMEKLPGLRAALSREKSG